MKKTMKRAILPKRGLLPKEPPPRALTGDLPLTLDVLLPLLLISEQLLPLRLVIRELLQPGGPLRQQPLLPLDLCVV